MTPFHSLGEGNMIRTRLLFAALLSILIATASADSAPRHFDIPAGNAEDSLKQFLVTARIEMLFRRDDVVGVRTNVVYGDFTPREALTQMLAGTSLAARFSDDEAFVAVTLSEAGD
jgi:iron complex outermembrane recepter protein